ncbi:uncharacterized protein LOC122054782 [Zingiber officinale]|uniref:DUF868 family protein n=1 Tax=Zingiber officinale TaxID=94328 RepID=A0A8J5H6S9_ZINOF|nr:uncharacterized protein LOC122054782 [Zingiber officinale]KAG6517979.1 hypothetical protein ZIOFF_021379 [Zingiber officinale]
MPVPVLACFRSGSAMEASASTAAMPTWTTSVYATRLGVAALTWSCTFLGISVRAVLRLADEQGQVEGEEPFLFRIRPRFLWKRHGSRRFRFKGRGGRRRSVDFVWDLRCTVFPPWGSPEPVRKFFVAVSVDGEMLLVAGDMIDEAYKKAKIQKPPACSALVSRLEHALMREHSSGRRSHRTCVQMGGRNREISIELGAKEKGKEMWMSVEVDGEQVLHVRRLRWKFRGSERLELDGGWIRFCWDLHSWFFQSKYGGSVPSTYTVGASVPAEVGRAMFLLRFEGEQKTNTEQMDNHDGNSIYKNLLAERYNQKDGHINWSWSNSGVGGEQRKGGRKTTYSSSSISSASSASTWSVMEWVSPEEAELRRMQGISLLVYAWKN